MLADTGINKRQHAAELARNCFQISYTKLDLATAEEFLSEFLGWKIIFKTDFQQILFIVYVLIHTSRL